MFSIISMGKSRRWKQVAGIGEGFEGVRALRFLRRRPGLFRMGIESELDDHSFEDVYEIKWRINSDEPFLFKNEAFRSIKLKVAGEKIA
jgi:hypothetical protein